MKLKPTWQDSVVTQTTAKITTGMLVWWPWQPETTMSGQSECLTRTHQWVTRDDTELRGQINSGSSDSKTC